MSGPRHKALCHDTVGFAARLKARVCDPANLAVPLVIGVFCLIRSWGLIADIPYWVIAALVMFALVVNTLNVALFSNVRSGRQLILRVGVEMAVIAIVIYGIGWGPILAIGFVFGAVDGMRSAGSAAARPSIVWTLICIAIGQVAIATGLAPTLIHQPLVHALGALDALGAVITIKVLEWFASARESSEGRFEALVHEASDIIVVADSSGLLTYVSPAFDRILGSSGVQSQNRPAAEMVHPEDLALLRPSVENTLETEGQGVCTELRLRHADGTWRWFEATVTSHLQNPKVRGIVGNLHDITARKQAEEALREAHERFRSAFENAPIGMAMVDLDGRILRANAAYARILGRELTEVCGMNVNELTHPDDREASSIELRRLLAGDSEAYRLEKRYMHVDGHAVWVSINVSCVRDNDGTPLYTLGHTEDITERRELRERLAHAAIHDPLTDLPNRVLFIDRLETALSRGLRHARQVAVIYLDLDRFKLVNDGMGHGAGDRLLEVVADRLLAAVRPSDTVARFGGDEFVVLCEEITDKAVAVEVAERLMTVLSDPVELDEGEIFVTASVGLAISGCLGDSAISLLRDADTAMYLAKERGRSRIEIFHQQSHAEVFEQMTMRNELHRALERGEFLLHYQPIIELSSSAVIGAEALVRWQHPTRGLLGPNQFISVAEDCGLIIPLGTWVLQEACRQAACWHDDARDSGRVPIEISVNVSARQLIGTGFVESVAAALTTSGINPGNLCLEITESMLMGDNRSSAEVLRSLRELGVQISIDDFGTGYSSLSYLKRFPIDSLKVDRSFVDGLGEDPDDSVIAGAVIALAHSLDLTAVAEGVETEIALEELRELGCDRVQGFLLGYPQPADELHAVIFETQLPDPRFAPSSSASPNSASSLMTAHTG